MKAFLDSLRRCRARRVHASSVAALLVSLLAACSATGVSAEQAWKSTGRIALLPLRDLSGDSEGLSEVTRTLRTQLERRGVELVDVSSVENELRTRRIRRTDSLDSVDAAALRRGTGAQILLLGTLVEFDRDPLPRISLSLRLLEPEGARPRTAVVCSSGESFRGLLGLGAIESIEILRDLAIEQILAELGAPATQAPTASLQAPLRLLVLPVENRSEWSAADVCLAELLSHHWSIQGAAQVVEPAELLRGMRSLGIRSAEAIDQEALLELARELSLDYFVRGTLEQFSDDVVLEGGLLAEVQASALLIDARTLEVASACERHRRGDEYQSILGLGIERHAVALVDRVSQEIVKELENRHAKQ